MSKVFSWKINDYNYGYLYIPNSDSLVSSRITNDAVLSDIASVVSSWSQSEYEERFNMLNAEISAKFNGATIEGNASDYYGAPNGTYIVLTGKDGANGKGGTTISEDLSNKITTIVNAQLASAKQQLVSENQSMKDWMIDKVNESVKETSAIVTTAQASFAAMKEEMSNKVDSATGAITTAASLFDMNGTGVNKISLQSAINKSNQAVTWIGANENKITSHTNAINSMTSKITSLESATAKTNNDINDIADTMNRNFMAVSSAITKINSDIVEVRQKASADYSSGDENSATEQSLSFGLREVKVGSDDDFVETETVDNGDGTFSTTTKIGNEEFTVKIHGFGGKLTDENKELGMSVASNGFRYVDKNGTEFSLIDGMLKMSNSSGSGKIEITEDGLYLNGYKYKMAK